jgi:hypothetical protein
MIRYPHHEIAAAREAGQTWDEIAGRNNWQPDLLRKSHSKWRLRRQTDQEPEPFIKQRWLRDELGTHHVVYPAPPVDEDNVRRIWLEFIEDAETHAPRQSPPPLQPPPSDPMLGVVNLYDAHFGMKVDGVETGEGSQDIHTISDEWKRAVDHMVGMGRMYEIERWLCPLGHDLSHVDHFFNKTGVTKAGTPQDVDSRLWKIFTATRRAAVYMIDALRSTGRPVDVVMVPGNHDADVNYHLGETVAAWYRNDDHVTVENEPKKRKYYGWGRCAIMLYHGELYLKQKGQSPPLIFATECPADIWVASEGGSREILSGHFHKRQLGRYTPTSDVDEERAIISRSLPGLTATDQWHYASGYLHKRAGTLLVYKKDGGVYASHEVHP